MGVAATLPELSEWTLITMVQFFRLINHQIEGAVMMFFSHQSVVLPV